MPCVDAILPAAGHSRRMGAPKLLLDWDGRRVIDAVLSAWCAAPVDRVAVVVRHDDTSLAAACAAYPRVIVLRPPQPPPDMKASVLFALDALDRMERRSPKDWWLLAPADTPELPTSVIAALAEAARGATSSDASVLVPHHHGRRGHPTAFRWELREAARRLADGEGLNGLLDQHVVHELELADAGILHDLDTPADYRRRRRAAGGGEGERTGEDGSS